MEGGREGRERNVKKEEKWRGERPRIRRGGCM